MRVLVIDDEPDLLLLSRTILELEGHHVLTATDAERAVCVAEIERPDVIVLDVMMRPLDGFAVLEELRRRPRAADIPVVMLTGRAPGTDRVRAWAAGVSDYVTKPFLPAELASAVAEAATLGVDRTRERRLRVLSDLSATASA